MAPHRRIVRNVTFSAFVAAHFLATAPCEAITRNWGGGIFGGGAWTSEGSWFNGVPVNNLTDDTARFYGFFSGPLFQPNLDQPRSVRGVRLDPPEPAGGALVVTFSGNPITLGEGGVVVAAGSGSMIFNNNVVLGADQSWNIATTVTVNGVISGNKSFQKEGPGTLRLEGTGSWTNQGIFVYGGKLLVTGNSAIPDDATVNFLQVGDVPKVFEVDGGEAIAGLTSFPNVTQATVQLDSFLDIRGSGNFVSGLITGAGSLTKSGSGVQTIRTSNSYSGGTTIEGGELQITTVAGSALGSGNVLVTEAGRLSGLGNITGNVTTEGDGTVAGNFTIGGLTMFSGGIIELDWLTETLTVNGAASISTGEMQVLAAAPIDPAIGTQWTFLTAAGGVTGRFDDVALPDLPFGRNWRFSYGATSVALEVVAAAPGDYNQDNIVDAADFTEWRDHFGNATSLWNDPTPGVDIDDYNRWKANFGAVATLGTGAADVMDAMAAPEPASLVLAVLSLAAVLLRRTVAAGRAFC